MAQPARRRRDDPALNKEPEQFGELILADPIVLHQPDSGLAGKRAALQVADFGTDSLAFYPMVRKTYQACAQSLRDFCGPQSMQQSSSDNAPELEKAAAELMVPHAASTPH
eukprot:15429834-Heterocapsa_arctica.AAC.1